VISAGQPGQPQGLSLSVTLPQPVQAGSTILVFATESNGGNKGLPISVSDAAGNPYTQLDQIDDTSNAAWQSLFSFVAYNVPAGSSKVTVNWKELEWQGVVVVEVSGVTSLPMLQHVGNVQRGVGTGANAITSGTITTNGAPGTVIGLSTATLDTKGAPNAGAGFTSSATAWNWNGVENTATVPSARLEYQHYASPTDVAATFTALGSGDNFDTLAIYFPDAN
jgi:hypothetical protein